MDANLLITLQNYGLSEKEAKIYLSCLELGSGPASTIARYTNEKRVTVYSLLKELKNKGIVNVLERKDTKYFSVVSPKILAELLEQKFLQFKEKVPEFLLLTEKIGTAPKINYLEGISSLEKLFADFATTTEDMRVILGTPQRHKKTFSLYAGPYRMMRKKKGLISRRIVTADNVDVKKELADDKLHGRKTVIINDFPLPIHADVNIYGPGKVAIVFFDKDNIPHALIIENNEVYTTMVGIFEYLRVSHTKKVIKKKK